jgi:hypothetical protein
MSLVTSSSFGAKSDDGVDSRGAAGGKPGSESDAKGKKGRGAEPDKEVGRGNFGPLMLHDP